MGKVLIFKMVSFKMMVKENKLSIIEVEVVNIVKVFKDKKIYSY